MDSTAYNTLTGKVVLKKAGVGVPNLLVVVYDLDPGATADELATGAGATGALPRFGQRLGSVLTDREGAWTLKYRHAAVNADGAAAKATNLYLLVLAPEDDAGSPLVLHKSPLVRQKAGELESYFIRVRDDLVEKAEITLPTAPETAVGVDAKVARYRHEADMRARLSEGVADSHRAATAAEVQDRGRFKREFVKRIATDFSKVTTTGVLVAPDGDIKDGNDTVVTTGLGTANRVISDGGVPVNLYLTPDDKEALADYLDDTVDGFATIPEAALRDILSRRNSSENPGTLLVHNNPIAKYCVTETADETCAQEHAGVSGHDAHGERTNGTPDEESTAVATVDEADLRRYMARLLDSMPSPDGVLTPAFNNQRADKKAVESAVSSFSLQRGPAEVPAFYDFHSLEIAFDHVWRQLLDEDLVGTAARLQAIYKMKFGDDLFGNLSTVFPTKGDLPTLRELPASVAANFDITREEFNDLTPGLMTKLTEIAENIDAGLIFARTVQGTVVVTVGQDLRTREIFLQKMREQGERIVDSVRHDEVYTLHKTLRDLHDRIKSPYEFTVFAADKDHHSVNFGILKTYRQTWTPLNYQAGRLVKTIALTPKEERKYGVKQTRTEKHVVKEATKNNSTLRGEQGQTTRAESDIVSKAQNKTNFNLSAEGTYNTGVYSAKANTSFGVEAQNESSQDRKDFHESVVKAAQEYANSTSLEVETETIDATELTESGTIVNPNDELSVTYLFYELQRVNRVQEQIYRVLPVVLVAQEVPAPHEINDAWVIANGWIINRFLLDDSFRPALEYLSTKSVGADFALRELRRNLRQQRAVLEALKIELSKATDEVDNRYRTLENSINYRIQQQSEDETDSWFSDVGEFFGGGGQNAEAAKAREIAAGDAHRMAVEKAQKVAIALQQETNALRGMTAEYNKTLQAHLDAETRVMRLLVHLRANIFYYMQAIWSMEPPDQRFLRLYKVQIPKLELKTTVVDGVAVADRSYRVRVLADEDIFAKFRVPGTTKHKAFMTGTLKTPFETVPLVEVADLDAPLGYKGNYAIFPLKQHNALTEFMAAPYVDSAFGAMDPDELANVSLADYSKYVCCLHDKLPTGEFEALKPQLKTWLERLLADPLRNGDEIVLPTGSLFITALPDVHPLLENFKLRHRELDVYKVQAEVRRAELENLRYAARLLADERGDPEIEKQINVIGAIGAPIIGEG